MPALPCPLGANCNAGPGNTMWSTVDIAFRDAKMLLDDHVRVIHKQEVPAGNNPAQQHPLEKLSRPQLKLRDRQINEETWEYFKHQWQTYKTSVNLTDSAKQHLEGCLGDEVTVILFRRLGQAGWDELTEDTLLDMVKEVFVKCRNRMMNRLKLRNLKQGPDQPVQQYVSSLKQIARTCKFTMVCSAEGCDRQNDYSEEMVLDQLTMGLNDDDIQKKVLGCKEENFNLNFVERLIINQECSKVTQKDSKVNNVMAPLSTRTRDKKASGKQTGKKCSNCGSPSHPSYRDLKKEEKDKCRARGRHCVIPGMAVQANLQHRDHQPVMVEVLYHSHM